MSNIAFVILTVVLCVFLAFTIPALLKGRFKKSTREEIEEKLFGNKN